MTTTRYFDHVAGTLRTPPARGTRDDRELVRLATLAASSHNTQPWRFRLDTDSITILPDRSRRCPVVDPDDAHLYRSLGCAAENLVHAAAAQGLATDVGYDEPSDAIVVQLRPSDDALPDALVGAITTRQSTRQPFDGTSLSADELALLERAGTGHGVRALLVTDPSRLSTICDLVARGNTAQLNDDDFRRELVSWIRFNPTAAERSGDGLAGHCSGNPPLPTWLARPLSKLILRAGAQVDRDTTNLRSSAGVAVFVALCDDRPGWIETGRACQRFALQAAVLDVRTAFVNQPIEVLPLRPQLESLLALDGEHAQLAMRFGHGDLAPSSLRRPLDEVIVR